MALDGFQALQEHGVAGLYDAWQGWDDDFDQEIVIAWQGNGQGNPQL